MPEQVTAHYIKKNAANYGPMPGVSFAIMKNFSKRGTLEIAMDNKLQPRSSGIAHIRGFRVCTGLECKLFFHHEWDEPAIPFFRSVVDKWPVE